jgi:hypothetical protein
MRRTTGQCLVTVFLEQSATGSSIVFAAKALWNIAHENHQNKKNHTKGTIFFQLYALSSILNP